MAITLSCIQMEHKILPPRIVLYGVAGVGKTTLATTSPSPIFILTEGGLGTIQAPAFPVAEKFIDVIEAMESLLNEEHNFKTLVIDSLDWLEPLVWDEVARTEGVSSIDEIGYGKGYKTAKKVWRYYLSLVDRLRIERDMAILQVAHSAIKRFDSPEHDPYDRYDVKLHASAGDLIQEHCDMILFAKYRTATTNAEVGFNSKVTRAVGSGERLLCCQERPGFLAKNRYGMPAEIPMAWEYIEKYIKGKK